MADNNYSRRSFFVLGGSTCAAAGLSSWIAPPGMAAEEKPDASYAVDYYDKLGVEKIINAAGTYTMFTAAVMPPYVQKAVAKAALYPVRLKDLQLRAGSYIAEKLHCEAALVSAGAASALTLGTAACVTVANQNAGLHVPQVIPQGVSDLKNEVIMQKRHRYPYDHALSNCGIRIIEVETLDQYRAAFSAKTVLAHFFNASRGGQIGGEDWIRIAHEHGVPCMNDAAADMPPISNLWKYTQMGFDLVTFSGGKGIRGPQNAGLLLGKKTLISAAADNNNSIDNVVGRGQKVAKEQIVGMVAAVDWILSQTDKGMEDEFRARANRISSALSGIPSLESEVIVPAVANHVPHLVLRYDQRKVNISALKVAELLRNGKPSIELEPDTGRPGGEFHSGANTIVVGVWMLQPGEDEIVAKRLREVLMSAASV